MAIFMSSDTSVSVDDTTGAPFNAANGRAAEDVGGAGRASNAQLIRMDAGGVVARELAP